MSYAIIGLVFVLLIVFGVLSSKQWHWLNITFLILTFVAGVAASAGMSAAYKLRTDGMKEVKRWEDQLAKNKADAELAVYGSQNSISYDPTCLRGINQMLNRELHGRGRVWPAGQVTITGSNRTFTFSVPREEAMKNNPMRGITLYAFQDQPVADTTYPVTFIGSFIVEKETATQVELKDIFVAAPELFAQPQGTWSLFEKMPADRRDAFKKVAYGDKPDFLGDNFDLNLYREALMTTYLPAAKFGLDPASAEYEALIDRYAFDGMKLGDITNWINDQQNRQNVRFEPVPEEVFVEFRFDKKVTGEFEVDAPGNLRSSGRFSNGRAVDPALQAGEKLGFDKDDTILIDQPTADGYQRGEAQIVEAFAKRYPMVTETDRYYFRQMVDYPFVLSDLSRQVKGFDREITRVKANNVVSKAAFDDTQTQIQSRDDIILKLDQDRQNMQRDLQVISKLRNDREAQLQEITQRSRQLDQQLKQQYEMIQNQTSPVSTSR